MNTILVPVDYTRNSARALHFALKLAKLLGARVIVFHAFRLPYVVPAAYSELINRIEREEKYRLQSFVSEVKESTEEGFVRQYQSMFENEQKRTKNLPLTHSGYHTIKEKGRSVGLSSVSLLCEARHGSAPDKILQAADAHHARLIVMGSSDGSEPLMGSTTMRVIRHSAIPVLAVPAGYVFKRFRTIVFAVNLFHLPPFKELSELHAYVKVWGASLLVLHFYISPDFKAERKAAEKALATLDNYFYDLDYRVYFQNHEEVSEGIQSFVNEQSADLLVLMPQKHHFFDRLLRHTVTGKIVSNLDVPILTLPSFA